MYTLNDYFDSPVIINYEAENIDANRNYTFPAVSICLKFAEFNRPYSERVEKFVEDYFVEHNIKMPKR